MEQTRETTREASRAVKAVQQDRAVQVTDPAFLDRYVRPHLSPGADGEGWSTEIIQLDGSGACTVQVELDGAAPVFAKIFPGEDGPEVHAKLRHFRARGFGAGSRYQSVEPLAWYPEHRLLLCAGAPGRAVADLVGTDDPLLERGVRESATWLARFHTSAITVGAPQSLLVTGELTSLAKRLSKVVVAEPAYVDAALEMIAVLDDLTHGTVDGLAVQSHGQYRPIHVFVADDVTTVIDLDRSAPADPARDVAEYLHRLRTTTWSATGDVSTTDPLCDAFLSEYRAVVGDERFLTNLRFHWARYLFHSLNRKLKTGEADQFRPGSAYDFYRCEFDRVVSGQAGA